MLWLTVISVWVRQAAIVSATAASATVIPSCRLAAIGQTYTVTPTFLIDGTLGWTRFGQNVQPPDLGTNFGSDVLGIPGTNGPDSKESGLPAFYISDYSSLGNTEGWNPLFRNDQSYHVQRATRAG